MSLDPNQILFTGQAPPIYADFIVFDSFIIHLSCENVKKPPRSHSTNSLESGSLKKGFVTIFRIRLN